MKGNISIISIIWPLFIAPLAYIITRYLLKSRRKTAKNAQTLLRKDNRQPVLYLRSFKLDWQYEGRFGQIFMPGVGIEKRLVDAVRMVGPVIAVGMPNESLPPLGAARMHFSGKHWQDKVSDLMQQAALVVIRPAPTEGVMWELKAAAQLIKPERLLIIFFFKPLSNMESRMQFYKEFRNIALPHLPKHLPERLGNAIAIRFDPDWTPYLVYPKFTIFQRIVFLSWRVDLFGAVIAPALREMGVDYKTPYLYRIRQYGIFIFLHIMLFTAAYIVFFW